MGTGPWSAAPTGRAICRRRRELDKPSEPPEGARRRPRRAGRELAVVLNGHHSLMARLHLIAAQSRLNLQRTGKIRGRRRRGAAARARLVRTEMKSAALRWRNEVAT